MRGSSGLVLGSGHGDLDDALGGADQAREISASSDSWR